MLPLPGSAIGMAWENGLHPTFPRLTPNHKFPILPLPSAFGMLTAFPLGPRESIAFPGTGVRHAYARSGGGAGDVLYAGERSSVGSFFGTRGGG